MGLLRGHCALVCVSLCLVAVAARADEPKFADFLARAHAQAAAGHYWEPAGNNAMDTFRAMASRLSEATPAQLADFDALLTAMLRAEAGASTTPDVKPSDRPSVAGPDRAGPDRADADPATTRVPAQPTAQDSRTAAHVRSGASTLIRIPATGNQDATELGTGAAATDASGSSQIVGLLERADQQIAAGHAYWPLGDNALGSLESVLALLPKATPAEAKAFRDLPLHFQSRAQEAAAAGNAERAEDYRQIADAISRSASAAAPTLCTASARSDDVARAGGSGAAGDRPALSTGTSRGPDALVRDSPGSPVGRPAGSPVGDPLGDPGKLQPAPPHGQSTADGARPRPRISPIAGTFTQSSPNPGSFVTRPSADARCRSLVQRMQIGEDLPDADRAYLRRGCP